MAKLVGRAEGSGFYGSVERVSRELKAERVEREGNVRHNRTAAEKPSIFLDGKPLTKDDLKIDFENEPVDPNAADFREWEHEMLDDTELLGGLAVGSTDLRESMAWDRRGREDDIDEYSGDHDAWAKDQR